MFGLAGKVAIVTGAATTLGIGRSSVLGLAKAGAKAIYALDLRDNHFQQLTDDVRKVAPDCQVITCIADAGSEKDIKGVCQRSLREFGRLDVFVANAGFVDMKNLWHTEVADLVSPHFMVLSLKKAGTL